MQPARSSSGSLTSTAGEELDKLLRHRPVHAPGQHDDQEQADGRARGEGFIAESLKQCGTRDSILAGT